MVRSETEKASFFGSVTTVLPPSGHERYDEGPLTGVMLEQCGTAGRSGLPGKPLRAVGETPRKIGDSVNRICKRRYPMSSRILLRAFLILVCLSFLSAGATGVCSEGKFKGKKILHVDSYHKGYAWSDGIAKGINWALARSGVDLKTVYMDSKRNTSPEFIKKAALKVKAGIEEFKPDVVIASDDNASKFLVMPYFKNAKLPFVFCGVNFDASEYGYPYKNATGMVEAIFAVRLFDELKQYAKGARMGFVAGDSYTGRKVGAICNKKFFHGKLKEYFIKTFEEFAEAFPRIQKEVDVLMIYNTAAIKNWNKQSTVDFVVNNTRIPTGALLASDAPYTLLAMAHSPAEQGVWAAQTALRILDGTPPSDIPITTNKKMRWIVNLTIAKKLGLRIDPALLEVAETIGK